MRILPLYGWFILSLEFGSTVLGMPFETPYYYYYYYYYHHYCYHCYYYHYYYYYYITIIRYIKHWILCLTAYPNNSRFVKNTLLLFLMFGNVFKHRLSYLLYYFKQRIHWCFSPYSSIINWAQKALYYFGAKLNNLESSFEVPQNTRYFLQSDSPSLHLIISFWCFLR